MEKICEWTDDMQIIRDGARLGGSKESFREAYLTKRVFRGVGNNKIFR